jgi:Nif-specific regulatory protein
MLNQSVTQAPSLTQREHHVMETPSHTLPMNESGDDERQRVISALEQSGWVQAKAARILGMSPRQIAYRIQTMNIHVRRI